MLGRCGEKAEKIQDSAAFITIQGQDLIKPDGTKLFIMGTNLGNWLNPEGYMFKFSKTNSPRFINEMFCQLVGPDFTAEFWKAFKDNYITREDIQFIKQEMLDSAMKKRGNSYNSNENPDGKSSEDDSDDYKKGTYENDGDFFIYPSPKKVLKKLVYNYVTGFMYGALVEASASEENARMMAMQSATNNAEEMLKELSVEYNRVRQAAITQEITEVIGGAKALKKKKKKQVR